MVLRQPVESALPAVIVEDGQVAFHPVVDSPTDDAPVDSIGSLSGQSPFRSHGTHCGFGGCHRFDASDQGRTAVTSSSTRKPGFAKASTTRADRTGRFGWSSVPKNCV